MAGSRKVSVIDGLSSVQAVRRTGGKQAKFRESRTALPATEKPPAESPVAKAAPGRRISQTALPPRHDLACYQCGYRFVIQGALKDTLCPKCHITLEARHVTIENEWSGTVRTIGTVEVRPGGVLRHATIVARHLVVEADITGTHLTIGGLMELGPGSGFDPGTATVQDLVVRADARIVLSSELTCRNLELNGHLEATARVDGCATIRSTGAFSGTLKARHLVVEDGGGLTGSMTIGPEPVTDNPAPPAPPETATTPRKASARPARSK